MLDGHYKWPHCIIPRNFALCGVRPRATAGQLLVTAIFGVTPHAFMVDAIRASAVAAEKRAAFISDAVASRTEVHKSGKGFAAAEVHAYVQARARRKAAPKPKAKPWLS